MGRTPRARAIERGHDLVEHRVIEMLCVVEVRLEQATDRRTLHPLEGEPPKGMVAIAFDSMQQAQAWWDSPAYRELRPIRHRSAKTRAYILEGVRD